MSVKLTTAAPPRPTQEANLGYLFRLAHQRFRGELEARLDDLGLSTQEYGILSLFESRSELSTSELARLAQVTRQTMHAAILSLEGAGLLERRAVNRRVVRLRPTKRGQRVLAAATERVRGVERAALSGLSRADERTVRQWLAAVAAMRADGAADSRQKRRPQ